VTAATSAGILLFRRSGDGPEVLLAHPGGPYWRQQDHGSWSVPKGIAEDG
jgi:predicted NUDIX family NTP pyrophosphohydrolase